MYVQTWQLFSKMANINGKFDGLLYRDLLTVLIIFIHFNLMLIAQKDDDALGSKITLTEKTIDIISLALHILASLIGALFATSYYERIEF